MTKKQKTPFYNFIESQSITPGPLGKDFEKALGKLEKESFSKLLWNKNTEIFNPGPAHQKIIGNSLGWLTVVEPMLRSAGEITGFARSVREQGFESAILLGMGGSSLAPEVMRLTFGTARGLNLTVLDSTNPATILRVRKSVDLSRTLFIVSSKSGTTIEPNCLMAYFLGAAKSLKDAGPGDRFTAITDPGTVLEKTAREEKFRKVFLNPPDIGGRFSALSYFGMVPAALAGINVATLLERAGQMACSCGADVPVRENPGAVLGAFLGAAALQGRDKVTLSLSREIEALGCWLEQLLAESTGKEGKGIVPVDGEELSDPSLYGQDRVFIHLGLGSKAPAEMENNLDRLARAGHPVVRVALRDIHDLAAEFFKWEFATAAAGWLLGINPFDQPNVQEAKERTKDILSRSGKKESPFATPANIEEDGLALYSSQGKKFQTVEKALADHFGQAAPGDYLAILAYLDPVPGVHKHLQKIRAALRRSTKAAATLGYGPRYLHSTGQVHKGGPDTGVFLIITADHPGDVPVPGQDFSFGALLTAQALGDQTALESRGRRVVRLHLRDVESGLSRLGTILGT